MRLIDADELKPDTKTFTSAYSEELTEFYSKDAIDNSPTVDAEPLRHREWTKRKVDPPPFRIFQIIIMCVPNAANLG